MPARTWMPRKRSPAPSICRNPKVSMRHDGSVIELLVRVLGAGHRRHVAILLAAAAACLLAGGAVFAATQHFPLTTGLYWAITTATTVGYGDVTPQNPTGRLVAAAVMLSTIPLLASVFALVTGAAAAGVRRILAMGHRFPEGAYRLVVGMNQTVPAIIDDLFFSVIRRAPSSNLFPAMALFG